MPGRWLYTRNERKIKRLGIISGWQKGVLVTSTVPLIGFMSVSARFFNPAVNPKPFHIPYMFAFFGLSRSSIGNA